MILSRSPSETWVAAAMRYAALEGVDRQRVFLRYGDLVAEGFTERRAAYLACAELGIVDG
jgi:hypothetical protein